jgi:phosphate starvation-inducible membrane PsiE
MSTNSITKVTTDIDNQYEFMSKVVCLFLYVDLVCLLGRTLESKPVSKL